MSGPKLPVMMGGREVSSAAVVTPDAGEMARYGNAGMHQVCATCLKFRLKQGQAAMAAERFLERLVIEEGWKTKHLGAPPSTFGLCAETNDKITSAYARACEHWRGRNGRIGDL